MAEHIGVSYETYIKYERGHNFPNPSAMDHLLNQHNLSIDWFIFGKGPKYFLDKKEKEALENEVTELKTKLEGVTKQRDLAEKELKAEKSARAGIPEMSEDIKELVVQMNRDPLLRYETLLQFQRSRMQEKGPSGLVEEEILK